MKIIDKIIKKQNANGAEDGIRIAFLGDSVTQGCFELYTKLDGAIETVFDQRHTYHGYLANILSTLYPSVPFNIINAGISGDNAEHASQRLHRDVLACAPDLVVVCFGLNDSTRGRDSIGIYTDSLRKIFADIQNSGSDLIFMTPNMMATGQSPFTPEKHNDICNKCIDIQNDGTLDFYIDEARRVCREMNVTVCDCYAKWKIMQKCGVNITELLANKCNHPTRDMNKLFAYSLAETILGSY